MRTMIEHLGKVFLSTHPNHAIAWSTLLSYVNGTWAERFPDRPPPENEEERVTSKRGLRAALPVWP